MEDLKKAWAIFRSYPIEGKMFIFITPAFAWEDPYFTLTNMDWQTALRYLAHAVLCWVAVEFVRQYRNSKIPKKKTRRSPTKPKPLPKTDQV